MAVGNGYRVGSPPRVLGRLFTAPTKAVWPGAATSFPPVVSAIATGSTRSASQVCGGASIRNIRDTSRVNSGYQSFLSLASVIEAGRVEMAEIQGLLPKDCTNCRGAGHVSKKAWQWEGMGPRRLRKHRPGKVQVWAGGRMCLLKMWTSGPSRGRETLSRYSLPEMWFRDGPSGIGDKG